MSLLRRCAALGGRSWPRVLLCVDAADDAAAPERMPCQRPARRKWAPLRVPVRDAWLPAAVDRCCVGHLGGLVQRVDLDEAGLRDRRIGALLPHGLDDAAGNR